MRNVNEGSMTYSRASSPVGALSGQDLLSTLFCITRVGKTTPYVVKVREKVMLGRVRGAKRMNLVNTSSRALPDEHTILPRENLHRGIDQLWFNIQKVTRLLVLDNSKFKL